MEATEVSIEGRMDKDDPVYIHNGTLHAQCLCNVQLFATLQTVACQTPPPPRWDFPSKNTKVNCHFLLQGIFPTQGSTRVSCIAGGFFTTEPQGKSMEYLLIHKKNETLLFATTWMNLESITLREITQTDKDTI